MSTAFGTGRDLQHLALVMMELLRVAYQCRLQLSFEGPIGLEIAREFVLASELLGLAADAEACAGRVKCQVTAPCESGDIRWSLDRVGFLVVQSAFQLGGFISHQR